ncbi:MAG: FtsX-like permease family protein, partial [Cytophagales bacterium]
MIRNYLKIAWRNLVRNKMYSGLTLFGLASGIACTLLLGLYVADELSYDRYHANADKIYRLNMHIKFADNALNLATVSAPMGLALRQEYPEVKNVLRIKRNSDVLFRAGETALTVKNVIYADSTLFSFFDYDFLTGKPTVNLLQLNTVIITEKLALSLFGRADNLLGKVVMVKENLPLTIAGVIRDIPANHHLSFDAILPYTDTRVSGINLDRWDNFGSAVYVMLNQKSDQQKLESKMPAFYQKYIAKAIGDESGGKDVKFALAFQPLVDMHLHSTHLMGEENGANMTYVVTFFIIGLFILLIAIVNYINLATARATGRAKEIGVRKAIGSIRLQLVWQFLTESMLLTSVALVLSLLIVSALLPVFNSVADKTLTINILTPQAAAFLLAFTLGVGLVSGLYPAFVLSGFKPVAVLKGTLGVNMKGALLRKSLVVLQFTISIAMMVGTGVVYRQLQFMRHTQLGFNQEQILALSLKAPSAKQAATTLKDRLIQSPLIKGASLTNGDVGGELNNKTTFSFYAKGIEQPINTEYFSVDHDFLNVLQINIKEGQNFAKELASDSTGTVLVNEAMLRRLGWKNRTTGLIEIDTRKVQVAGVIRDFHLRSLHNKIEPLVLVFSKEKGDKMLIRVAPQNIPAALAHVKAVFAEVNPNQPFDYTFLDQTFAAQYRSDERKSGLFLGFSGIAILIACLGLFGLATFTAEQRTKEIGVRKVLGASVASI